MLPIVDSVGVADAAVVGVLAVVGAQVDDDQVGLKSQRVLLDFGHAGRLVG